MEYRWVQNTGRSSTATCWMIPFLFADLRYSLYVCVLAQTRVCMSLYGEAGQGIV